MFKIIMLSTILIFPLSSQAQETCDLIRSLAGTVLELKTNGHAEKKVLEGINKNLEKYKEDFTYNQFRKLKLQMESIISKTYRDKTKKNLTSLDYTMYGIEWANKCERNQIRIY